MFEDLKLQRMQGGSQKEKRRLLVTVSMTLVLGAVTWPYWGCHSAPAPVAPPARKPETAPKVLDLAPLKALRDAGGSAPGVDLAALDYVLSEVRKGELKREADSATTIAAVDALDPKSAVGASLELRGTVRSLEREAYTSPGKMAVDRLWTFALEDADGKRVLVHHVGSSNDPDEGMPRDAYKDAAPVNLSDGDVVRMRAFYLQQRTSGTAGSMAIDRPTAVLVGREYRRSLGSPAPVIGSLAEADWAGVEDRFMAPSRSIEDRAHYQTLAWAKSLGHNEVLRRIRSKEIPVKEFDRNTFLDWKDELTSDERRAIDAPDARTWTNAAKGHVFATTGLYIGDTDKGFIEDWDHLPPNAFDVTERWTWWFLSDHFNYASMRMSSPFPQESFAGIDPGARQLVTVYGVFLKNYTYDYPNRDPITKETKSITVPFFVVLHMEPIQLFRKTPLYENAFWWVTVSLAVLGILFYVVLIRGERREAKAAESHRIGIRQRARAKPGVGGAPPAPPSGGATGGSGGPAPGGGPSP